MAETPPTQPPAETPAPTPSRRERRRERATSARREDSDIFLDEVSEELRREQLIALAWRVGPVLAAAAVALILAVGISEYLSSAERAASQNFAAQLIAAGDARQQDAAASTPAFMAAVEAAGTPEAAAIARLYAAEAHVDAGDQQAALDLLAEVSGDAELPPRYRHLAVLKSVLIRGDAAELEPTLAALEPLTAQGAPYRRAALVQIALAHLRAGDTAQARAFLEQATEGGNASEYTRQLATQALDAIPQPTAETETETETETEGGEGGAAETEAGGETEAETEGGEAGVTEPEAGGGAAETEGGAETGAGGAETEAGGETEGAAESGAE